MQILFKSMKFSVTVLGNGSALPTSSRNPSAQLINYNESLYLIDCGEGAQQQLRANSISFTKINNIFISHVHGDHFFGLFGLIYTFDLLNRQEPLNIYCHKELKILIDSLFLVHGALRYDILYVFLDEINEKKIILEDKHLNVFAFPLSHRIKTHAFIFEEKKKPFNIMQNLINFYKIPLCKISLIKHGADYVMEDGTIIPNEQLTFNRNKTQRSYCYCSDTIYMPKIVQYIKGIKKLYHETTYPIKFTALAKKTFHSTTHQAAQLAKDAEVITLLIGHFSSRQKNNDFYLNECKEIFENTIVAEENKEFEI